jgi:hypothetical protein
VASLSPGATDHGGNYGREVASCEGLKVMGDGRGGSLNSLIMIHSMTIIRHFLLNVFAGVFAGVGSGPNQSINLNQSKESSNSCTSPGT